MHRNNLLVSCAFFVNCFFLSKFKGVIFLTQPIFFNSQFTQCKTPFGAVAQGQSVIFTLFTPPDLQIQQPRFAFCKDGCPVEYRIMHPTASIDGQVCFTINMQFEEVGLYFYYFDLWKDYTKVFRGEDNNGYLSQQEGASWQLTVYQKDFATPAQLKGGVMYQIFPDRFYESAPKETMPFADRIYRTDKQGQPYFWPNELEEGYLNMDYFGGDLEGIRQKLPYLQQLGITILYLNPIFEAHSNHRYNTANYLKIDPLLGTEEDFTRLCNQAKELEISVILDGVFSHTGSDSLYFNREGRYGAGGAFHDPNSPYRSWFDFSPHYHCGYRSWWGFDTLPEVNENSPSYRNFICGEGGVIDYWIKLGASGFRLDVADELPDDFIQEIRLAVKRHGADKYLLGEVWEDATTKWSYGSRRRYLLGAGLDSVMNYPFRNAILNFLKGEDARQTAQQILSICENYPPDALHTAMNFLSTHDTERAITYLVGEPANGRDRFWQSNQFLSSHQYQQGIAMLRLAFVMLFTLPGIPSVYYGDEIAMQGYRDPFNRGYFQWQSSENQLKPLIQLLSQLRKEYDAFQQGSIQIHSCCADFLHYSRKGKKDTIHVAINRSCTMQHFYTPHQQISVAPMNFVIHKEL